MTYVKRTNGFPSVAALLDEFMSPAAPAVYHRNSATGQPAVNIRETDNAYILEVAAPGRTKEDFQVKLEKGLLLISGKAPETDTEETWLQREFGLDAFERSFRLPDMADLEQITATYADGVLQVRIGKRGDRQRRIDIS